MEEHIEDKMAGMGFIYSERHYWNNPIIGKEIVRFRWGNPIYKGHFKVYHKIHYFDQFIMDKLTKLTVENDYRKQLGARMNYERI